MIRTALVSYINTRPFIDGLEQHFSPDELDLQLLPPSACSAALATGQADLALTPVGGLVTMQGVEVMKDYCIGADGAVDSVFLFAQRPLAEIETLVLDPHSRSSNALARVLLQHHWQVAVQVIPPGERHFEMIRDRVAGVAIGDAAYKLRSQYAYVYDLSAAWKAWTGLPFVFAVWAYRPDKVAPALLNRVRLALADGLSQRAATAKRWASAYGYTEQDAYHYLTESISYELDAAKHAAFELFFHHLLRLEEVPVPGPVKG